MFESYYDYSEGKAKPISDLVHHFEEEGTLNLNVAQSERKMFSARDWTSMSEKNSRKR